MATGLPNIRTGWRRNGLATTGIVYYLERADGAIKIGCTRNYPQRREALARRHGALALVAWEHGYYEVEERRHDQFAGLRITEPAEWFRPEEELVDHVLMLLALLA